MINKIICLSISILIYSNSFSQNQYENRIKFKLKINHDSSVAINSLSNSDFYKYLLFKYDSETISRNGNPDNFAYANCVYSNFGALDSIHITGWNTDPFVENTLDYFQEIYKVKFKGISYKTINVGFLIRNWNEIGELSIKAKILKINNH